MLASILSVRQVELGYYNLSLISNINIDLTHGDNLAIVGFAGSGKTTLLNAIAGNTAARKGTITYNFGDIGADPKKHIAFVPARHHFRNLSNTTDLYYQQRYNSTDSDDALTVEQYLRAIAKKTEHNTLWDFNNVVDLFRLQPLSDKQLIKLSNGETKRLMMAAALLKHPKLLLLDAPLNGLDVQTRSEFETILQKISDSGITIIITTSAHEIPGVFNKVAAISKNELIVRDRDKFDASAFIDSKPSVPSFDLSSLTGKYPAPAYQAIIKMEGVTIKYGNKQILHNIDWQIKQGERWALLGPNGAGKSTLLSLINGDNPQAYANRITLFDRKRGSGESIWDIKKKTGFTSPELFQYFPADSSCLHTIESGYYDTVGLFRPSDPNKVERALKWMKVLGIDQYARQLLKNIPASAQRLCLLARAMIKCPTLLILDEPTQGMDDTQIAHFRALVDTICRETNITLIYVTHYQEHLPDSVDHVLRLAEGKVISH